MFERIRRGWGIVKASWTVLKHHPKLLVFPIISGLTLIVLVGAIAGSVYLGRAHLAPLLEFLKKDNPHDPIVYAVAFVFYFVCSFIVIFFNAALVFCAMQAFAGRAPSLRAGLATAAGRLPQILGWTLVAATVGVLLNALENTLRNRLGFIGAMLGGLLEFSWAVATYFVVPVVVVDGLGPIAAVKRSAEILKRTWGESIGGVGGLGIISFVASLPVFPRIRPGGGFRGQRRRCSRHPRCRALYDRHVHRVCHARSDLPHRRLHLRHDRQSTIYDGPAAAAGELPQKGLTSPSARLDPTGLGFEKVAHAWKPPPGFCSPTLRSTC
jgi:Family of unknown function (DUF6159)